MKLSATRKSGAAICALALSTTALVACSSDETATTDTTDTATATDAAATTDSAASAEDRGPITFAMGKNDTDKIIPIIEKWNAEHPDEQVTLSELAGEADAQRETLVQSLQAGNADYDVMALDVVWTADFAANQWLEPLEGDYAVDTSKLLQPTVDSATYNGKLYALPQNTNGQLLFRNVDLIESKPDTFADIKSACEAVEGDCLTTQLKQYEGLTVNTLGFINGWGGAVIDDSGEPTVESAEAKAGLQALVDAYADGTIAKGSTAATEEEGSAVKGKTEVSPLVGKDGVGVSTLGGYNNGINVNSKYKATARDFIEFVINEENQLSFAEASFPPVLASIYDDADLIEKYPYLPALKESLENAQPRPVSPFYPAISKAIQDNAYAALTAGKSVDDATADMAAAIKQAQ